MTRLRRSLGGSDETAPWSGAYQPYDLVKELCVAIGLVGLLVVVLAVLFSSPDEHPSTIKQWSRQLPINFAETAVSELDGTSETARYGPPYNDKHGYVQHLSFLEPQEWLGVSHPLKPALEYVVDPLRDIPADPPLHSALAEYEATPAKRRLAWGEAYGKALEKAKPTAGGSLGAAPSGAYGPVPTMIASLLALAQSGGLDGDLLTSNDFYQTDYTKPLMFLEDGSLLDERAEAQHLLGTQWGMMNETGSYPGQVWLWLYTFWYQIEPIKSSPNADLIVMLIMALLSLAFICIPFLPGIRDLPRKIPIYKLIWREHYRSRQGA